jgi:hypothetical protein
LLKEKLEGVKEKGQRGEEYEGVVLPFGAV